jgi:hypothetical protein
MLSSNGWHEEVHPDGELQGETSHPSVIVQLTISIALHTVLWPHLFLDHRHSSSHKDIQNLENTELTSQKRHWLIKISQKEGSLQE